MKSISQRDSIEDLKVNRKNKRMLRKESGKMTMMRTILTTTTIMLITTRTTTIIMPKEATQRRNYIEKICIIWSIISIA